MGRAVGRKETHCNERDRTAPLDMKVSTESSTQHEESPPNASTRFVRQTALQEVRVRLYAEGGVGCKCRVLANWSRRAGGLRTSSITTCANTEGS